MTVAAVRLEAFDRHAVLANGHTVHLRPAEASDAPRVREFYERLGDTSTYYRFFGLRRAIPDSEVDALVAPQLPRHATVLACVSDGIVGIGEMHVLADDPLSAEVAFAVSDELQGQGIGTLLLEDLAVVAEQLGVQRLVAETLPGNTDMQLVFRTAGLPEQHRFEDGLMDVVMDLGDQQGLRRQALNREAAAVATSIEAFFRPQHVVVFGDGGPGTAAARRIAGALGALFRGRLTVVDSSSAAGAVRASDRALARVRTLAELEDSVDLAVVAVAPEEITGVLVECAAAGARSVLVVSTSPSGTAEACGSLAELAHELDLRIIGPCAGIAVPANGLLAMAEPRPFDAGPVAVLVGDDAPSADLQREVHRRGIGISAFVTLGRSDDVVVEDLLLWWAREADTRAVLLDLERLPDRHRYHRIARHAAATKPVIALANDASSELVDDDGVIRATDQTGLLDLGALFAVAPAPHGPRVVCVTSWASFAGETVEAMSMASPTEQLRSAGLGTPTLSAGLVTTLRTIADVAVTDGWVTLPPALRAGGAPLDERIVRAVLDSGEADACLVRRRGQLVVEVLDNGAIASASLGPASWQRGVDVIARAVAWRRHADSSHAGGAVDELPDELYVAADGTVEPLR